MTVVLTVENLSKSYGDRLLFEGVNFGIDDQDRIGLIGANGAGKSTLLKLLLGKVELDSGRIATRNDAHIEYLSQNPTLDPSLGALEQILSDGPEAFQVVQRYERACRELELRPQDTHVIGRMERLSQEMDRLQAWSVESEARAVLGALGIEDHAQKIEAMSGGQQKRVALARALLRPSDLLILDEPTNHLDVETIEWLESYLSQRQGALLLITHDRYFLDRVTTVIFELAEKQIYRHEGNYSYFLESRAMREETQAKQEQKRAQLAKTELAWLRRGPQARTTKAKARIERANELIDARYGPERKEQVTLETVTSRLGKKILEIENLSKSHGARRVLENFTYTFKRGERLGIVGPNGVGKSTLLNLLTGRIQPDAGTIEVGETVVFGYYDQNSEELDESKRVHDYIVENSNRIETADGTLSASQMLERFLFSRQRQWDPIAKLSGGERRRLYLLKILMQQPNVLLLDEPTNDLDVETLTVLEDYLDSFEGVVITVSHDRYFLDRVVDHLLIYESAGTPHEFPGGYSLWLEEKKRRQKDQAAEQARIAAAQAPAETRKPRRANTSKKMSYMDQREYEALMPRIEAIEQELSTLNEEMSTKHDDYEALQALMARQQELEEELERSMERWMELEEMLEG